MVTVSHGLPYKIGIQPGLSLLREWQNPPDFSPIKKLIKKLKRDLTTNNACDIIVKQIAVA